MYFRRWHLATKYDDQWPTPVQEVTIAALLRGATVTAAAAEAGVARQTVSGWKHSDPAFMAALNRGRLEVWEETEDRIRLLRGKALNIIDETLDGPNGAIIALEMMKVLARMNAAPPGPTTEGEIAYAHALRETLRF